MINKFQNAQLIIWDFDGVIKDSIEAKGIAFVETLKITDKQLATRVREDHMRSAGVNRQKKIEKYLTWLNRPLSQQTVKHYLSKYSEITIDKVCESDWVPGAREYILNNYSRQKYVVASSAPQLELQHIMERLKLDIYFEKIHGYPKSKFEAATEAMNSLQISPRNAFFIGDTDLDKKTAESLDVAFCLRRTTYNSWVKIDKNQMEVQDFYA